MANKTLQFCGYAYGEEPVQLNAHINGQLVFSGTVATLDEVPTFPVDMTTVPVLFSVTESALFPTSFAALTPQALVCLRHRQRSESFQPFFPRFIRAFQY